MLPDFPQNTVVKLNSRGTGLQRKLSQHGGRGIAYTPEGEPLTREEAAGSFTWNGTDGGRYARVRSLVSGREGQLGRDLLRVA